MGRPGRAPAEDSGEWEYILDTPNRRAPLVKLPDTRGLTDEGDVVTWHPLTSKGLVLWPFLGQNATFSAGV